MARFVILRHDSPRSLHWDLMLEHAGALRTWALESRPAAGHLIAAEALADHRIAYLDYEGPISGDRGTVAQWDHGEYVAVVWSDDIVNVELNGQKLRGTAELTRDADPARTQRWSMRFISASSV
jgi:hypothetical protein